MNLAIAHSAPPTHGLMLDPGQTAAYRAALVEPSGVKEPTVLAIDLEGRFPLASALHELIVPLARAARSGSLGPLMLVICTPSVPLRDMLEALAEKHQLALFVAPSARRIAEAEPIGDLTATERETLETMRRLGGAVNVATFAQEAGLSAPAATNRLVNLVQKGFVQRDERPRSEGTIYLNPYAVRADEVPAQLPPVLAREVDIFAAVRGQASADLLGAAWTEWASTERPTSDELAQAWLAYRHRHSGEISESLLWAQQALNDQNEAAVHTSGMTEEDLQVIRDAFE
ncbi:MAG: hypothetical protein JWQ18_1315 [Conexibacter sp.]|nr:hypothetical protein [Conexibacter sp.]